MMKKFIISCLFLLVILLFSCSKNESSELDSNGLDSAITMEEQIFEHTNLLLNRTFYNNFDIYVDVLKNKKIVFECISTGNAENSYIVFENSLYKSPEFLLTNNSKTKKSWRIPPIMRDEQLKIQFKIDGNYKLQIDSFSYYYEPNNYLTNNISSDIVFDSHLGFSQMCPECTASSVEMAGLLGYESCIVVPKETLDGEIVCIHDDTINRTALYNGNYVNDPKYVNKMTYNDLLLYDFGGYKHTYWEDEKILKLEDFFVICKKYNMRPIFSTHPGLSKESWMKVKLLLQKYNLLDRFTVKAFELDVLNDAYSVFLDEIYGYTGDNFSIKTMNNFVNGKNLSNKLIIETNYSLLSKEFVSKIINSGYEAYAFTIDSSVSEKKLRNLILWGITGFTDDTYCQKGLF